MITVQRGHGGRTINPSTSFVEDDFLFGGLTTGIIGQMGWNVLNGTVADIVAAAAHPGTIALDTTTTADTLAVVYPKTAGIVNHGNLGEFTFIFAPSGTLTGATYRVGLLAAHTDNPGNGAYIERLSTDTNFFVVCRSGGSETRVDTGIAPASNTYITLRIRRASSGSTAKDFYVNNNSPVNISTNVPTGVTMPLFQVINVATAASRLMRIDYYAHLLTGITRI